MGQKSSAPTSPFQRLVREQIVRNVLQFGGATVGGIAGVSALAWFVWRSFRS